MSKNTLVELAEVVESCGYATNDKPLSNWKLEDDNAWQGLKKRLAKADKWKARLVVAESNVRWLKRQLDKSVGEKREGLQGECNDQPASQPTSQHSGR